MRRARTHWATLVVAAGTTAALGEPVRRALLRRGALDIPNHRSSHTTPVPRGGGIAALLGATTAALVCHARPRGRTVAGVLGLAAIGLADDLVGHIPAGIRLTTQLVAGLASFAHTPADAFTAAPMTAYVVNAVNFMDGINGISGMTAAVWGINAMLLGDESGGRLANLGALVSGAGLGFLPHNLRAPNLFLGDVGSYALGSAIAAGILSQDSVRARLTVAAPLTLYLTDVSVTLLQRWILRQPLGEAHRDHTYQRLVDQGHPHHTVALMHALASIAIAASARSRGAAAVTVPCGVAATYLATPSLLPRPRT